MVSQALYGYPQPNMLPYLPPMPPANLMRSVSGAWHESNHHASSCCALPPVLHPLFVHDAICD